MDAHLVQSKEKQKQQYDHMVKSVECKTLQVGDFVWLHKPVLGVNQCRKFKHFWGGPYQVLRRLGEVDYRIIRDGREMVVHRNRLKKNVTKVQDLGTVQTPSDISCA